MLPIEDKKHPITAGMDDFEISDETYHNQNHPEAKMHNLGRIDRATSSSRWSGYRCAARAECPSSPCPAARRPRRIESEPSL